MIFEEIEGSYHRRILSFFEFFNLKKLITSICKSLIIKKDLKKFIIFVSERKNGM